MILPMHSCLCAILAILMHGRDMLQGFLIQLRVQPSHINCSRVPGGTLCWHGGEIWIVPTPIIQVQVHNTVAVIVEGRPCLRIRNDGHGGSAVRAALEACLEFAVDDGYHKDECHCNHRSPGNKAASEVSHCQRIHCCFLPDVLLYLFSIFHSLSQSNCTESSESLWSTLSCEASSSPYTSLSIASSRSCSASQTHTASWSR